MTPDAQAVLLLCGSLPQDSHKPLSPTEYDRVARTLQEHNLRPAQLLSPEPPLVHFPELEAQRLRDLLNRGMAMGLQVERWSRLAIWVLGRADSDYPRSLKQHLVRRSPPLLYGLGDPKLLGRRGVAIVGSRTASTQALEFARKVAQQAVREGLSVISGGARGVDTEAMDAALEAGGPVVGVLAGGLEKAATARKYRPYLAAGQLCLISSCAPPAGFTAGLAMARNSLIYCLAQAAFVADSGLEGGTWTGACENLKRGWVPLFVRPGGEAGNARLVEQGARWFSGDGALGPLLVKASDPATLSLFDDEPATA